jgi:hypothetical protein
MALERRRGCMDWLLHGDVDWETLTSKPKEYSPGIAGALFGAGWWCWSVCLAFCRYYAGVLNCDEILCR